jgi:hypothetical protein
MDKKKRVSLGSLKLLLGWNVDGTGGPPGLHGRKLQAAYINEFIWISGM